MSYWSCIWRLVCASRCFCFKKSHRRTIPLCFVLISFDPSNSLIPVCNQWHTNLYHTRSLVYQSRQAAALHGLLWPWFSVPQCPHAMSSHNLQWWTVATTFKLFCKRVRFRLHACLTNISSSYSSSSWICSFHTTYSKHTTWLMCDSWTECKYKFSLQGRRWIDQIWKKESECLYKSLTLSWLYSMQS